MSGLIGRRPLSAMLADQLRARIREKEWASGEQIPTEADLCVEYEVSRSTVRQAIKVLEGQGLLVVRHGRGSFVSDSGSIHAGIQELTSITQTIAAQGHEPGMDYRSKSHRPATAEEREQLGLQDGADVLAIQRAILADGATVAYSYDTVAGSVLPTKFDASELTGSVFAYLEQRTGLIAARAIAEVHAVESRSIGWGQDQDSKQLYVLLDQLHYDSRSRPFMRSRTYFVEGRFNFVVQRTR